MDRQAGPVPSKPASAYAGPDSEVSEKYLSKPWKASGYEGGSQVNRNSGKSAASPYDEVTYPEADSTRIYTQITAVPFSDDVNQSLRFANEVLAFVLDPMDDLETQRFRMFPIDAANSWIIKATLAKYNKELGAAAPSDRATTQLLQNEEHLLNFPTTVREIEQRLIPVGVLQGYRPEDDKTHAVMAQGEHSYRLCNFGEANNLPNHWASPGLRTGNSVGYKLVQMTMGQMGISGAVADAIHRNPLLANLRVLQWRPWDDSEGHFCYPPFGTYDKGIHRGMGRDIEEEIVLASDGETKIGMYQPGLVIRLGIVKTVNKIPEPGMVNTALLDFGGSIELKKNDMKLDIVITMSSDS